MVTSSVKAVNWLNGWIHRQIDGLMDLVSFHHPNLNCCISLILGVITPFIGYFIINILIGTKNKSAIFNAKPLVCV